MKKSVKCLVVSVIVLANCYLGSELVQAEKDDSEWYLPVQIADTYNDTKGIITIISDDGDFESGKIICELAKKYGVCVTIASTVYNAKAHLQEWQEMEESGAIEMVSHSYDHIKMEEGSEISQNEQELKHQILDADSFFEKNFKTKSICFITPENKMCANGYALLDNNGFYAVGQGTRGYNSLSPMKGINPFQWLNLARMGVGDVTTTEERNAWVDYAIDKKQWLIEMWHIVSLNGDRGGYQEITEQMADEHLAYINSRQKNNDIWVASLTDATKYLYEKEVAEVYAKWTDNELEVSLSVDKEKLPKDIFDHPLTLKIAIPYEWKDKDIYSTSDNIDCRIKEEYNVEYAVINLLPNGKNIVLKCK